MKTKFTESQIILWLKLFKEHYGEFPKSRNDSRIIPEMSDNWQIINICLTQGLRGLNKGNSTAKLLEKYFGVRNIGTVPNLTIDQIINWIELFNNQYGEYPHYLDIRTIPEMNGENWTNINKYLINGFRGLNKGNSLPQLLEKHFKIRNIGKLPKLTELQIVNWLKLFHDQYGEYPIKRDKRKIIEMGEDVWSNIEQYLNKGFRGLPGGSSIPKIKEKYFGVRNRKNLPKFTESQIKELIINY